jgi:tRNA(Ile)-lysidine synthase
MSMLEDIFYKSLDKIFPDNLPKKVAVGVSGGLDSMALLCLLKNTIAKDSQIFCVTVDHNFREDSAKDAQFVADFCQKNDINCTILKSPLKNLPETNIEASLREVRYGLLQEFCRKNEIEHLFIAHHRQDLAENFLIRLFRGSGIDGLAALDYSCDVGGLKLIRPLLDFNKEDLKNYLLERKISWVEDESNKDERFLRNKIRNFLQSLPEPDLINQRITLASKAILESKKILANETKEKMPEVFQFNDLGYFLLQIKDFKELEEQKALRYLVQALMTISGNVYKPRLEKLQNLHRLLLCGAIRKSYSFYGCILEELNDSQIIIYREKAAIKDAINIKISDLIKKNGQIFWDNRLIIDLDEDLLAEFQKPEFYEKRANISTINAVEFNKLIKENNNFKHLKNIKNPLKKVYFTIPVLKIDNRIINFVKTKKINF